MQREEVTAMTRSRWWMVGLLLGALGWAALSALGALLGA
jgi:hypothetical protein